MAAGGTVEAVAVQGEGVGRLAQVLQAQRPRPELAAGGRVERGSARSPRRGPAGGPESPRSRGRAVAGQGAEVTRRGPARRAGGEVQQGHGPGVDVHADVVVVDGQGGPGPRPGRLVARVLGRSGGTRGGGRSRSSRTTRALGLDDLEHHPPRADQEVGVDRRRRTGRRSTPAPPESPSRAISSRSPRWQKTRPPTTRKSCRRPGRGLGPSAPRRGGRGGANGLATGRPGGRRPRGSASGPRRRGRAPRAASASPTIRRSAR